MALDPTGTLPTVASAESFLNKFNVRGKRAYVCPICNKSFKRSEHCTRHKQAHSQERPYKCRFCDRCYARKDLTSRHEKSLHKNAISELLSNSQSTAIIAESQRPPIQDCSIQVIPEAPQPSQQQDTPIVASNTNTVTYSAPTELGAFGTSPTVFIDNSRNDRRGHRSASMEMTSHGVSLQGREIEVMNVEPALSPSQATPDSIQPADAFQLDNSLALFDDLAFFSTLPNSIPYHGVDSTYRYLTRSPFDNTFSYVEDPTYHGYLQFDGNASTHATIISDHDAQSSQRSVSSMRDIPQILEQQPLRRFHSSIDEDLRNSMLLDVSSLLGSQFQETIPFPAAKTLQRYLASYFKSFHNHFPLFHSGSFNVRQTPAPLLLASCAIGALYNLDRKQASNLRDMAQKMLRIADNSNATSNRPLWQVQCKFLIVSSVVFGGSVSEVIDSREDFGYLMREYHTRRVALMPSRRIQPDQTWQQWTDRELSKRLLYGIYVISSLQSIIYDYPPGFTTTGDLDLEMPSDDLLWDACTEEEWRSRKALEGPSTQITVRQALEKLISGKASFHIQDFRWPAFASSIILHAVMVHMWHVTQCTQSITAFSIDTGTEKTMRGMSIGLIETGLARCNEFLESGCKDGSSETTWDESSSPLVFNCFALVRTCRTRLFTCYTTLDRSVLLSPNNMEISRTVQQYVESVEPAYDILGQGVEKVFQGLMAPLRASPLLVKKTAAFSWSIEYAIAAFEGALFFTKWIHETQIRQQYSLISNLTEQKIIKDVTALLESVESDYDGSTSLAAAVAKFWGSLLDDVWVWRVTQRMGLVLNLLGDAFEKKWMSQQIII